jgi:adenosylhomocysteine nucleosidase
MKRTRRAIVASLAAACLTACVARDRAAPAPAVDGAQGGPPAPRPVVVQGAMDVEVRRLAQSLENATEEKLQGWTFWRGTIDGYPVVVSKTLKGLSNAAAATALAAQLYHPVAVINQGTSGGHQPDLKVYDIVLGAESVNLGSFKTGYRPRGKGSLLAEWVPLDLMRTEGSAGEDPDAHRIRRFPGDVALLAAARSVRGNYQKGRVVEGVIGSAEVWNSEIDRIEGFHEKFGTTVEEMETASAAQIAGLFEIPFLGIRVLSNNITNGGKYDPRSAEACQEYVADVVKAYISQTLKPGQVTAPLPAR